MFQDTIREMVHAAKQKKDLMDRSPLRYFLSAMLAGAYVGIGIVLIMNVGAPFYAIHSPATSIVMGASFGIALTLVIIAGSELFTGNNMYFTLSTLAKATTWKDMLKNWGLVFIGNLAGAMVLAFIVVRADIFHGITADHVLMEAAKKKMTLGTSQLFFRGILCNWLVCLAIWTSKRVTNDAAKLILIWWMLYAFIASGYEHSVANMTIFGLALLLPHPDTITIAGWLHNMIPVTLGNIVGGGLFLGTIYWLISPYRERDLNISV
ncbi:formate/nitrite transporter family protein [Cohnella sp. REN36]|uniref:formate/nitrite transporter family protein n=1 Tax=Cohnella sp. REN36 TaxID=2887347 RepID=UPI001D1534C8|nr:formate/nitrite transporter family protein [Cohnella sp. REN36]MCC3373554.1 formate/nitrite transporter family protein [Cohnella sp. REN36]